MNVIGRLTPSIESQVDLKKFRGISTADALYRMPGVRITGFLGSITAIYGFAIDIFEDIQKEIDKINKKLEKTHEKALKIEKEQIEIEKKEMKKKAEFLKQQKEKEKKLKEEKEKNLLTLQKLNQTNEYNIFDYDTKILSDDKTIIDIIGEFEGDTKSQFHEKYKRAENKYYNIEEKEPNEIDKNENRGEKPTKKYEYDFPYEYQYSYFEDRCLKSILKQRAGKFDFFKEQPEEDQSNEDSD